MPGPLTKVRFVIPASGTESNEADLTGVRIVAFQMPAAWTAADLRFKSRPGLPAGDGYNDVSQDVYDAAGALVALTVVAGHFVVLTGAVLDAMVGLAETKLVSQNAQSAEAKITAMVLPIVGL